MWAPCIHVLHYSTELHCQPSNGPWGSNRTRRRNDSEGSQPVDSGPITHQAESVPPWGLIFLSSKVEKIRHALFSYWWPKRRSQDYLAHKRFPMEHVLMVSWVSANCISFHTEAQSSCNCSPDFQIFVWQRKDSSWSCRMWVGVSKTSRMHILCSFNGGVTKLPGLSALDNSSLGR